MIFGFPQSCTRCSVMVEEEFVDTHAHTHTHTHHLHFGHDWPKPQAPMWNESVKRALFLHRAALWVNSLTQTLTVNPLAHFVTCTFSALWLSEALQNTEHVTSSCLCPVTPWPSYLEGFVCLFLDPRVNSLKLAWRPVRDVQSIWPFSTCPTHWLGYRLCVGVNRYFPIYSGASAEQACAEVHKDPLTFSTLLEAKAPGTLCVLICMYARLCVYKKYFYILGFGGKVKEDSTQSIQHRTNTSQPQTKFLCLSVCVFKFIWDVIGLFHSIKTYLSYASYMYLIERYHVACSPRPSLLCPVTPSHTQMYTQY